jgi:hypothetical protein
MLIEAGGSGFINGVPQRAIMQYEGILAAAAFIQAQTAVRPAPYQHPLEAPTVDPATGAIVVNTMLRQPERITRIVLDLTRERFIADRLFTGGGGVTGGALIFDRQQAPDLYPNRDVEIIAPATEFPLNTSELTVPETAEVEKWGSKDYITDEARDRNDIGAFTRKMRQLANAFVLKLNQRAVNYVQDAIADGSRDIIGNNWAAYDPEVDPPQSSPAYDFGRAQMQVDNEEQGVVLNLWLINPMEALALTAIYGANLNVPGFPNFYSSPRVPAGEAYAVAEKQVGGARIEKPLGTVTWREDKTERTWVQSSVRPLWYVDNLPAILHFRGLDGTP